MVRSVVRFALFWLLILAVGEAGHAAVDVRVDRDTVRITDSFRIEFESDKEMRAQPDFSALDQDFEVLSTTQSTSVQIINGRTERSTTWTVDVMARHEGVLTIPSIQLGDELSEPLAVIVKSAARDSTGAPAAEVFVEVEADPVTPYVQAQTLFTVRLFHAVPISDASLTEPRLSGVDAIIEKFGEDTSYETERSGVRFRVVERRYAIFPQSSGNITIEPLQFEGRIGRGGLLLDPFARGRVVRTRSEAIELEVRPIPEGFRGRVWLPAQRLDLVERWPAAVPEFRVGEPVTRTLQLVARGLTASHLPEIGADMPDGLKQYPDQPVLETIARNDTMTGSRQEKIALIPSQAGQFTLPAIEIPWWNTVTDRLEYARLAARIIEVLPAAGSVTAPPPVQLEPGELPESKAQADLEVDALSETVAAPTRWIWVSLALAVGWLGTLLAWWLSRRRQFPEQRSRPRATEPLDLKAAAKEVKRACADNDSRAAQRALLQWARCKWPGNSAQSLGELGARFDGELQREILRLSRVLYATSSDPWVGDSLWRAFEPRSRGRDRKRDKRTPSLEPLYRT